MIERFEIGKTELLISTPRGVGEQMPLAVYCAGLGSLERFEAAINAARKDPRHKALKPYCFAAFLIGGWGESYSPWPIEGEGNFTGGGKETLGIIKGEIMPFIENMLPISRDNTMLIGYSLAGLFALWALYEEDIFSGCACCSGSLWYDHWMGFMEAGGVKRKAIAYLSLGRKEALSGGEKYKNVGEYAIRANDILSSDRNIVKNELVWHNGGHVHEAQRRVADALIWLISNS